MKVRGNVKFWEDPRGWHLRIEDDNAEFSVDVAGPSGARLSEEEGKGALRKLCRDYARALGEACVLLAE